MSMRSVAVRLLPIVLILSGAVWCPPAQAARRAVPENRAEEARAARMPAPCPPRWPYIVLSCMA